MGPMNNRLNRPRADACRLRADTMNSPSFAFSIRLSGQMLLRGGWLVPALLAWQRLLDYLNDDLARLHFTPSSALVPMPDINEAANIAAARQWMLLAAIWLGLAILSTCVGAWRARAAGAVGHVEAGAGPVMPAAGAATPQPTALLQQMDLLSRQVAACRESLAGESARVHALGAATDDTQRDRFERLEQRLSGLEGLLQRNGEQLGHQLGDLRERMATGGSINQSDFGDLATGPVPLLAGVGSADDLRRLRDLVLNLSDLKADLRIEQRQLRQRLRDLPDAGAAGRPKPPRAA
jgi:hypothetical protein